MRPLVLTSAALLVMWVAFIDAYSLPALLLGVVAGIFIEAARPLPGIEPSWGELTAYRRQTRPVESMADRRPWLRPRRVVA